MTSKRELREQVARAEMTERRLQAAIGDLDRLRGELRETGRQRDQYRQWWDKEREYRVRQNDPSPHTPPKTTWTGGDKVVQGGFSPNTRASEQTHAPKPRNTAWYWYEKYIDARNKADGANRRERAAYDREEKARRAVERLENENRRLANELRNPCAEVFPRTAHGMTQSEVTAIWDAGYAVGYRHGSTP